MNETPSSTPHLARPTVGRALVLGGGGSTGNAWLIGVIAGLSDAGLDVTTADVIIGTSAGATAAAQVTSAAPADLYAAIVAAAPQHRTGPVGSDRARVPSQPVTDHLERLRGIIAASQDAADMRRRMGAAAIERETASDGSWQTSWRATVAARLPSQRWPHRPVRITSVDAQSASGLPYRIRDRWYIDGGYRSNAENADLAAGYACVLVLSPFGGRSLHPLEWGTHLATQVEGLRAGGSRVETIFPGRADEDLFGANAMDVSMRPPAARAGYDQGRALALPLTESWGA
jgi:NTE family protein